MSFTRERGLQDAKLIVQLDAEGIRVNPEDFSGLDYENTYAEQVRACFDWNFENYVESKIPAGIRLKTTNFYVSLYWNPNSQFFIEKQPDGTFFLRKGKEFVDEIYFEKKPEYYNLKTSTGKEMSRIAQATYQGRVQITYSNECALLDKGLDCQFCNINDTKRRFGKLDNIEWKNPTEIAEAIAAAYERGHHGFNLTGGFVPERREVEYYLDVIEATKQAVGHDDVHGMACVGAPSDLSVLEKYKEAGYQHIATNLEIWDENIFKSICPGKEQLCGGRKNWLEALKYEVEVFGKGYVRSCLVGGLESKESLLEGVEQLAELGVIAAPTIWKPCIGSALEGHQSPVAQWHQEVAERTYQIYKKYGFTYEQYYYTRFGEDYYAYRYKLDGEYLPWEKKLDLEEAAG